MDREAMKKMTGAAAEQKPYLKLNQVTLNGDSGVFEMTELMAEKNADGKYNKVKGTNTIKGVILRMRWRMSKFKEGEPSINTTEYDNKNTDVVMVFPSKEKMVAVAAKEKYALSTQRVIYFYLPSKDQTVRLIVKASGLGSEKNPGGEMGLFEYTQSLGEDTLVNEVTTVCTSVFRTGTNQDGTPNKRKDHYAMTFTKDETPVDIEKMAALTQEIYEQTQVIESLTESQELSEADKQFDAVFGEESRPTDEALKESITKSKGKKTIDDFTPDFVKEARAEIDPSEIPF